MNVLDLYYQDKTDRFNEPRLFRTIFATEKKGQTTNVESGIEHVLRNPDLFSNGRLLAFADTHFNLKNPSEISEAVIRQLLHACEAHIKSEDTNTLNYGKEFDFFHLNPSDFASLYTIINSFQIELTREKDPNAIIFRAIAFDMRDNLLRLCVLDPENAKEVLRYLKEQQNDSLAKTIEMMERTLDPSVFSPIFHPLVSRYNTFYHRIKDTKILLRESQFPVPKSHENHKLYQPLRKLKVWKVSLENSRDSIGGVASVITAAYQAHKKMKLETVHSFHPLYSHNKLLVDLRFKGTIHHEFCGLIVTSSVYKNLSTGEYFIQPDPRYNGIFDVSESKNLYREFTYSSREDRYGYLSSAIATAVATYCGKKGTKSVDVLEAEAWHASPAFELLAQHFDPIRQECGLPQISRIIVTHMLVADLAEQGILSSQLLSKIGADTTYLPSYINYTDRALRLSNKNLFVSQGLVEDILSYDLQLNKCLRDPAFSGGLLKIQGIRNGINSAIFDVSNSEAYGIYAVTDNNFVQAQNHVKQSLFKAGIIADPKKPLLLFVGRFSWEKGIEMLPAALEEVKNHNGQMVIMGQKCDDENSFAIVQELQKLSETDEYKDVLRVYLDRSMQMEPFTNDDPNCKVRKGWLLRQAASMVLVPSFSEACGLVPMETQCAGAITISSRVQGLKDMCIPINSPHITQHSLNFTNGANAVCYENCLDQEELRYAIAVAYSEYNCLTEAEKNMIMKGLRNYAIRNYDWVITDEHKIIGGSAFQYSTLYHDLVHANERNPEIETLSQALDRGNKRTSVKGIEIKSNIKSI